MRSQLVRSGPRPERERTRAGGMERREVRSLKHERERAIWRVRRDGGSAGGGGIKVAGGQKFLRSEGFAPWTRV